MGLFRKSIKGFDKVEDFKPQIDCIKPINWLGSKLWYLQTDGFARNNGGGYCFIRTYPLFKTCDMFLDLTNNTEYKLVQIGTRFTEIFDTKCNANVFYNEVIEKFNNLVHTIENKDDVLLNKLNDAPWHKVNEIDSIEVYLYEVTDECDVNIIIAKEIEI